jgi:hypothetical protein
MKDSKTKPEESTRLTYTGLCHSCCHTHLDTSLSRGRKCLSGCVTKSDAPVYMCARGGGWRESCALRNAISVVIHT